MNILAIENEHRISRLITKGLRGVGYSVEVATDKAEALESIKGISFDMVIVDRDADTDGLGVVSSLRNAGVQVPVFLLTGDRKASDRRTERKAGADSHLVKPFALNDLIDQVYKMIGAPASYQGKLTVEDLSLDVNTRIVQRQDQKVHLTGKEFALLELLMRNVGKPVSKDEIMDYAWHYEADVMPNTIEVYIKYLRHKIDDPFEKKLLHTSRGFGYRIEV
jgi:DNA-binding response OmpR family regulator